MKTVLVSSIKGGTGKSLIALNIALRLREKGYSVGFIDADIDSSYFTEFTKAQELKIEADQDRIVPAQWNGIKVFSMSLLVGRERAISMYGFSQRQILNDIREKVVWDKVDYIVIDLPSGASDVFKETLEIWADSLIGGIIVMIPFAELAARRLLKLYTYEEVPVLGIIENMAYIKVGDKTIYPFGTPCGSKIAKEYNVPYLGAIPLDPRIVDGIMHGSPLMPEDISGPIFKAIELIEKAKPGSFYERWKEKMKTFVKAQLDKLLANLIVHLNKTFNIADLQKKYGFTRSKPFMLVITDRRDKPITAVTMRVKDGKLVVIGKKIEPEYVIELSLPTFASIILGYKKIGNQRIHFDVYDAWAIGELKVYGRGSTNMLVYVAKTLLGDKDVLEKLRKDFGDFLEKIM